MPKYRIVDDDNDGDDYFYKSNLFLNTLLSVLIGNLISIKWNKQH